MRIAKLYPAAHAAAIHSQLSLARGTKARAMTLDESYRKLGVKPGATLPEIKRSYRELLKFFHPDRHQSSPTLLLKATEETKKLNIAYERVLKAIGSAPRIPSKPKRTPKTGNPPIPGQPYVIPSCGTKLNWVAPGRFLMGSPATEAGRSNDEGPQTEVTITRGFWLGVFAVTQEEWKAVAEGASNLNPEPSLFHNDRLPVEYVSWYQCQLWLQELNSLEEDRLPAGFEYCLPTEAEWEFTCRAGTSTAFNFGNDHAALDDYAWYSNNSRSQTHPVGEKKPNNWSFYDMHGNVWEWCQDRYGPLPGGTMTDPQGSIAGLKRVFRGGSWGVAAARCRSAYRVWNRPDFRDATVGFRVALAPSL
jgi:formylglycine-generating enzyme required for sulfatase activity